MTRYFSIFLLLFLCPSLHAQVQPAKPADEPTTGTISGRVVTESGQPLAGASLFVRAVNSATSGRITTTDADGNFRVNGLEPALYTVGANAPAYTSASSSDPTVPPTFYRIGDSVRLELVRGGAITGTITNGLGEPVVAVRVRATLIRDASGHTPRFAAFFSPEQSTDDRGIYRIYGLAPGTYLVSAGGMGISQPFQFNPYDSDVPTYSPSSTRDNAAEVSVRSGEDSTADIRYRGEPGHVVSGTVKAAGTTGVTITLTPAGNSFMPAGSTFQLPDARGFAFNGVADGDYDLVAQEVTSQLTSTMPSFASSEKRRITVKGANVSGIELITKPLASLSGRFILEPSKLPECQGKRAPLLAETLIQFRRDAKEVEKEESVLLRLIASSASPDPNGAFVLRNLLPGRYQIQPRFYARYWYLKSMTLGTASAVNWTAVKSGDQLTNLTITLAEGAASVRGRVAAAEPPSDAAVYLIPAEQNKTEEVLRFFVTELASDGTFALNNVPPGRYLVLMQTASDPQTATLAKLREPEAATARAKLRRTAETLKSEIELKPCQNLTDYQLKQ